MEDIRDDEMKWTFEFEMKLIISLLIIVWYAEDLIFKNMNKEWSSDDFSEFSHCKDLLEKFDEVDSKISRLDHFLFVDSKISRLDYFLYNGGNLTKEEMKNLLLFLRLQDYEGFINYTELFLKK